MSRPGYFTEVGLHPCGSSTTEFHIPKDRMRHFLRFGPKHKFFESLSIPAVLKDPLTIFRGLEREQQETGYCYAGVPEFQFKEHNITASPPPGLIFTVYANAEFCVFEWRWEVIDPLDWGCPFDSENRFRQKLWHR
jgi:hypothetical protein